MNPRSSAKITIKSSWRLAHDRVIQTCRKRSRKQHIEKQRNYYQDKVFQQLSKGYSVEIIDTSLESEISPYIPPVYKWRILIGRISWRTPAVSPRENEL